MASLFSLTGNSKVFNWRVWSPGRRTCNCPEGGRPSPAVDRTCGDGDSAELEEPRAIPGWSMWRKKQASEGLVWTSDLDPRRVWPPKPPSRHSQPNRGDTALITARRQVNASDREPGARPSHPRLEASASNCPGAVTWGVQIQEKEDWKEAGIFLLSPSYPV